MSTTVKKPWKPSWVHQRDLPGGGQAQTFVVRRSSDNVEAVLKILKRQDDDERRRRMHREVAILQTLCHPRIPRLIESNSGEFETDAVLYLISEFVPGSTLAGAITKQTATLDDAATMFVALLQILEYTHGQGIIHRDIKPDNIMLRDAKLGDPVLIDFGISFNEAEDTSTPLTNSLQQLGNRFLTLPELQLSGSPQRDKRSDVTQALGVFFYSITGIFPVALADESNRLPHQRENVREFWNAIPKSVCDRLLPVFDRGFTLAIDQRWQSAADLRNAIEILYLPEIPQEDVSFESISQRIALRGDYDRREKVKSHATTMLATYETVVDEISTMLGSEFSRMATGHSMDWEKQLFGYSLGFSHALFDSFSFWPRVEGKVAGNEIIFFSTHNNEYIEFLRFSIDESPDLLKFREHLIGFYKSGINRALKSVG